MYTQIEIDDALFYRKELINLGVDDHELVMTELAEINTTPKVRLTDTKTLFLYARNMIKRFLKNNI